MLFTIQKESLLKLFKLALFVTVEKKSVNSIVGTHVLLEVKSNVIKLIATDLDVELIVEEVLLQEVQIPGTLVIPFRKINEICRAITENIILEFNAVVTDNSNLKLKIKSDRGFFNINYLPAETFPVITNKEFKNHFSIKASCLRDMLNKVTFAMGDDDSRHFLNGVFLEFSQEKIIAVAADGHRLMVAEVGENLTLQLICQIDQKITILVPRKSVFDILKIIADLAEELFINIAIGNNHVRLEFNNIVYSTKLLNAIFPPYKNLIPINSSNIFKIDREALKNACLRAVALLGDRSQAIKFKFTKSGLVITGANEQGDLVEENLPAILEGRELEICFNIKYLLDFLSNTNIFTVIFKFENATSGVIIQDLECHSIYVLMPMQI